MQKQKIPMKRTKKWHIQIIDRPKDFEDVRMLHELVWGGGMADVIPMHLFVASTRNGGLVLGAYSNEGGEEKGRMIGFVYGFPGAEYGRGGISIKFCSHEMGIHPEFRGLGVGFALKRAQWQLVRYYGYKRVVWTYDPLLCPNAKLNIHKLGAVCNTYFRDYYGEMIDELNKGITSDRFQVDWWVNSERVNRKLSAKKRKPLRYQHYLNANGVVLDLNCWENETEISLNKKISGLYAARDILLFEIPSNFYEIKQNNIEKARNLRLKSRLVFEGLFENGYYVVDFVQHKEDEKRCYYVLIPGEKHL